MKKCASVPKNFRGTDEVLPDPEKMDKYNLQHGHGFGVKVNLRRGLLYGFLSRAIQTSYASSINTYIRP